MTGPDEERTEGIYNEILATAIGRGAYDQSVVRNAKFLTTTDIGPYPKAAQYAWSHVERDPAHNVLLTLLSTTDGWGKLGPLSMEIPADIRNIGTSERIRSGGRMDDINRRNE